MADDSYLDDDDNVVTQTAEKSEAPSAARRAPSSTRRRRLPAPPAPRRPRPAPLPRTRSKRPRAATGRGARRAPDGEASAAAGVGHDAQGHEGGQRLEEESSEKERAEEERGEEERREKERRKEDGAQGLVRQAHDEAIVSAVRQGQGRKPQERRRPQEAVGRRDRHAGACPCPLQSSIVGDWLGSCWNRSSRREAVRRLTPNQTCPSSKIVQFVRTRTSLRGSSSRLVLVATRTARCVRVSPMAQIAGPLSRELRKVARFSTRSGCKCLSHNTPNCGWMTNKTCENRSGQSMRASASSSGQDCSPFLDRFAALLEHAPVMIWISGPDGRCVYVNERWLEFTGRAREQELGTRGGPMLGTRTIARRSWRRSPKPSPPGNPWRPPSIASAPMACIA